MSGANARYTVVPTVTVLAIMKTRLLAATKGHALLKKKADALNMRFRQVQHCHLQNSTSVQSLSFVYSVFVWIICVRVERSLCLARSCDTWKPCATKSH